MFIFPALVGCLVLTTLGYFALWTSSHENTSKGLVGFGKVLAVILFVFAGLVFLVGAVFSFSPCMHEHMQGMMMKHCPMMGQGCSMKGMNHDMEEIMENKDKMTSEEYGTRMKEINETKEMNEMKQMKEMHKK